MYLDSFTATKENDAHFKGALKTTQFAAWSFRHDSVARCGGDGRLCRLRLRDT